MRSLVAFIKKEAMEQTRSGRLTILTVLFVIFGIMNPAVAKLTPWLLDMFADSLSESGMIITDITVTAIDSWMQFYKNIPMALIAFVLLQGGIFTKEYRSGTLILSLTKGLERHKVVISKALVLLCLWTAEYWLCFGITYGYNAYFWDNSIAQSLGFSAIAWWIFGCWTISLMVIFSAISSSTTGVLIGTGAIVLASYLISIIPNASKYLPTKLADGSSVIYGASASTEYVSSILITSAVTLVCLIVSVPIFNKKQL